MRSEHSKNSFAEDEFEHPQGGPVGLHRGSRSVAARLTPYIIVVVIAMICGVLAYIWLAGTGETGALFASSSNSQSQNKTQSSTKSKSSESESDTKNSSESSSTDAKSSDTSTNTNAESTQSTTQNQQSTDNAQQNTQQTQQNNQEPNHAISVAVVNGTGRTGYAASKASTLTSAGYTSVAPQNPTDRSTLPNTDVVWYENASDEATAQDIAKQLGITQVVQAQGIGTPITVVLMQ